MKIKKLNEDENNLKKSFEELDESLNEDYDDELEFNDEVNYDEFDDTVDYLAGQLFDLICGQIPVQYIVSKCKDARELEGKYSNAIDSRNKYTLNKKSEKLLSEFCEAYAAQILTDSFDEV